ncbi:MAG: SGNH hydrolase domain-containing protein, partial [Acidimicrobiales bacterium]
LVGDSMAGSLGVGLGEVASRYGAVVANEGDPGCSVSMDKEIEALIFTAPPGAPCRPGDPQALLDTWKKWVDSWNPDVVIYLARGEVLNQVIGGSSSWVHIGEPAFDARLAQRYAEALTVLGARGAKVYLLGSPLYHTGTEPVSQPSPFSEDDPARVQEDDALMRAAVARDAGAGFIDIGAWVTPGDRYRADQDGIQLRCSDGVHFTPAGGTWVATRLFPLILSAARAHQAASPGGSWPGEALPDGVPSWYSGIPC